MNEKKINICNKIESCISMINEEIDLHLQNKEADGDVETLEAIKVELERMKISMSPEVFYPTYDYILRDALWDYMKISDKLLDAYYSYINL